MNDKEKLVSIYSCGSSVEAAILRDKLENEGIPCMLTNETFSSIYPIGHSTVGAIQILVFEKDSDAALRILEKES